MATNNAVNLKSSGIAGYDGAGAFNASAVTNHAVLVGGADNHTITSVAATANTGAILQNNSSADPSYSTATYPSTTTVSQILYSSSTNTVAGLATANRGVLTTGTTGIPVVTALATDGQVLIGSTSGTPSAATLTPGAGISITNASNAITIANTTLPGFAAKLSGSLTNVTGDATNYTVIFDSVVNQQGGTNYNNSTGVFTAPSTGYYLFTYALSYNGLGSAFVTGQIFLSTTSQTYRTFVGNPANIRNGSNMDLGCGIIAYMSSGNTASLVTSIGGSTKTISISSSFSTFSGWKLG